MLLLLMIKRSSNFKGKIGMMTKLLHNLALIRDSLFFSHLFQGCDRRTVSDRCRRTAKLRSLQEY